MPNPRLKLTLLSWVARRPFLVSTKGASPTMRKLIVCNIVSLDGFFSGPGGDVMAMPFDKLFRLQRGTPPSGRHFAAWA